ncbi:hypothetical protein VHEMI01722 [[Torrubiella] hemipterigena]|uniref:Uncharacterized protein n=1 Tax=[Torrubiella] hemipterigena TaxID=1531966 RepID=A0A0A1T5N2_9HYPO|nr:hypothetical protein VHEMI01722 [[Torrubiella] hemipterigena]
MLPRLLASVVTTVEISITPAPLTRLNRWTFENFEKNLDRQRYFLDSRVRTSPAVDGYDRFPFQIWKEAHRNSCMHESGYSEAERGLRWYGYVLRDFSNMSEKDISRLAGLGNSRPNESMTREQEDVIAHSFTERKDIFDRGGRGYWSPGDTSRIVWQDHGEQVGRVQEAIT